MKLATLRDGSPDGRLAVVSRDGSRFLYADGVAANLQQAIENWDAVEAALETLSARLNGNGEGEALDLSMVLAPLPRAWQWLDGSAFASHGALMDKVIGHEPEKTGKPLMYQGVSSHFFAPREDIVMPSEELGIDFEGEFGIITDRVPMGTSADKAMDHVKLLVLINDWSLRKLAAPEMKTGFGWIQAKPPCAMGPFAVTPDELGDAWRDGRVHLNLRVDWNGAQFGNAHGGPMGHGFHELVAHAAYTRDLVAGTVIGSGTVSNENYREIGSSCIAERRGIEIIDQGEPKTPFMAYGDRVRMEALSPDGVSLFGAVDQRVLAPEGTA